MLDKQTIEYLSTAAQYIHLYTEEVTDYAKAETYAGHRSTGHLQNFLKAMEWENNSILILERLSPIEEETEPEEDHTQKWTRLNKEKENIDKEVYVQLGQIPDTLKQRIANYKRNLEEFLSNLEQDWEVQADTEDNLAANISIAQEEYDADPDSTDSETALQQNWALDDSWGYSDSESEIEQDFQNKLYNEPPNIDQIREEARNLHIIIPEGHHAYEN